MFLGEGTSLVMADRAFVVYRLVASMFQAETIAVPMTDGLVHDLPAMAAACRADTRLLFVANPNNPSGTIIDPSEVDSFLESVPKHVIVVFDEAYIELIDSAKRPALIERVESDPRIVILRTFSKAYGLAGLRLGYAVGHSSLISLLERVRQPFNANAMAQEAGIAALDDSEHLDRTREMVKTGLLFFEKLCDSLNLQYVRSVANFILIRVGDGRRVFRELQREGVIVRPMGGYQLEEYVRVTLGTVEENQRCADALRKVLS